MNILKVTRRAGIALDTGNFHLNNLKRREACELLWDAALPQTLEEISFFEQEKTTCDQRGTYCKAPRRGKRSASNLND